MPLYEYRCMKCRSVTGYLRPADRRNEVAYCSECGAAARRIISKPQKFERTMITAEEIHRNREVWR